MGNPPSIPYVVVVSLRIPPSRPRRTKITPLLFSNLEKQQVFVGGLRESEDSVHITEEELATYFSKFGIIESVSINRDDRTHRGRGFAFVKFFQEVRIF